jgi:hypothetical protein
MGSDQGLLLNTSGMKLVRCLVQVEKDPSAVSTEVDFLPIVGFQPKTNGSFHPVLVTGPLIGWGEYRASVGGCFVYGVCADTSSGVSTADQHFSSIEDFTKASIEVVLPRVGEVRREKGWPAQMLPNTSFERTREG